MKLSSWPEALLWQHYVHAQTAQASRGLISHDLLALAVEIGEGKVRLHIVVSQRSDEVLEDIDYICSDLDDLLEGHTLITAEVYLGFGAGAEPGFGLLESWARSLRVIPIYVSKGALVAEISAVRPATLDQG
jgi:hypothetical protein